MPKIKQKNILYLNDKTYLPYTFNKGQYWFKAKEVSRLLDYHNPRQSILEHVPISDKKILQEIIPYHQRELNAQNHQVYINLNGLYTLLTHSQKPNAKQLHYWLDVELGLK